MLVKLYRNNPNIRDIRKIVEALEAGRIIVLPTDSLYAFACSMEFKGAVEKMATLKGFSLKQAKFSMLCDSIAQMSNYVRPMSKELYTVVRNSLPGAATFIMDANNNVPRNYQNANKTIGVRVPADEICHAIIEELGVPLIATSVRIENEDLEPEYLTDPELIEERYSSVADIVVDGGIGDTEPSTVVNCSGDMMEIVREGKGDVII